MATRHRAIVEMQVGRKTAADVDYLCAQRNEQRSITALNLDVAARWHRLDGSGVADTRVEAGDGVESLGHLIDGGTDESL